MQIFNALILKLWSVLRYIHVLIFNFLQLFVLYGGGR